MPSQSMRSIRVSEVPLTITTAQFHATVKAVIAPSERAKPKKGLFSFGRGAVAAGSSTSSNTISLEDKIKVSLAPQFGAQFGTVTFSTRRDKALAQKSQIGGWGACDDVFDGITVLHSPVTADGAPDLDIVAVHGLNGNAMDTWMHVDNIGSVMWLRDLLPHTLPFGSARIMTFGYNSRWADKKSLSGLSEWSNDLLDRVCSVRTTTEERKRPIIFICHSLGGLVTRQAMIRLNGYQHLFQAIQPQHCAILFLATPHSGSSEADWNKYLVDLAELIGGLRADAIVNPLRSHDPISATANEDFGNMKHVPHYECFHETQYTKVGLMTKHIVTKASASLNGKAAFPIANVDHNSICKYDSKFRGGYLTIVNSLLKLKGLLSILDEDKGEVITKPDLEINALDMPPVDVRHYPLPSGRKWYEGKGLRTKNQEKNLSGRQEEMKSLGEMVVKCQQSGASAIAVTGIGGIGKTELLLEIAYQRLNQTNIFFLHASDKVSLEEAYFHIARRLGHDILLPNNRGAPTLEIWNSLSPAEKIDKFKDWLQQPENSQTIFILDDLDGLHDLDLILSAIPREAPTILFSSRNPILQQDIHRMMHNLRLSLMAPSEIVQLMEMVLAQIGYESEEGDRLDRDVLLDIAIEVDGHPLAAIIAIRYITTVVSQSGSESPERDFLDILRGTDFESRRRFLEYRPGGGGTNLMDIFLVSKSRLRDPDGLAWKLMQFVACLETDPALTQFRRFFYNRESFAVMEHTAARDGIDTFPDRDLLAADDTAIGGVFAEFETVSFGEKVARVRGGTRFHPLWKECALHVMGEEGRVRVLSQVVILATFTIAAAANEVEKGKGKGKKGNEQEVKAVKDMFEPHIRHAMRVCKSFRIGTRMLRLPEDASEWMEAIKYIDRDILSLAK